MLLLNPRAARILYRCPSRLQRISRIKSAHILPGNNYLQAALGTAACPPAGARILTWLPKYRRIAVRGDR
jgi:transposase